MMRLFGLEFFIWGSSQRWEKLSYAQHLLIITIKQLRHLSSNLDLDSHVPAAINTFLSNQQ